MNLATAAVIAIIAIAAVLAVIHLLRHPETRSCDGACSGCALKDSCKDKRNA